MSSLSDQLRRGAASLWWVPLLRGIIAIIFGLVALFIPGLTIAVLLVVFAAYVLIDGVLAVMHGFRRREVDDRWWAWLLDGALSIGIGLLAIFWPAATALAFVLLIGIFSLLLGVTLIVFAFRLRGLA